MMVLGAVVIVAIAAFVLLRQKSATPIAGSTDTSYTMVQVATHKTPADCWAAVNGKVYNLTSFIQKHPGGDQAILSLCGIDGSAAFNAQHGGQEKPEKVLEGFAVGTLK